MAVRSRPGCGESSAWESHHLLVQLGMESLSVEPLRALRWGNAGLVLAAGNGLMNEMCTAFGMTRCSAIAGSCTPVSTILPLPRRARRSCSPVSIRIAIRTSLSESSGRNHGVEGANRTSATTRLSGVTWSARYVPSWVSMARDPVHLHRLARRE